MPARSSPSSSARAASACRKTWYSSYNRDTSPDALAPLQGVAERLSGELLLDKFGEVSHAFVTRHLQNRLGLIARLMGTRDQEMTCDECVADLAEFVEEQLTGSLSATPCRRCKSIWRVSRCTDEYTSYGRRFAALAEDEAMIWQASDPRGHLERRV